MVTRNIIYTVLILLGILQSYVVQAGINCGLIYCTGSDAYCCYNNVDQCCWHTIYVYELWWFWFIWFLGFMLIISCVICLRRRRLQQRRYIRVVDPYGHPAYGTTATLATTHYNAPPPPAYGTVVPNAPAYPDTTPGYPQQYYPQSHQQNMEKPPSYQ